LGFGGTDQFTSKLLFLGFGGTDQFTSKLLFLSFLCNLMNVLCLGRPSHMCETEEQVFADCTFYYGLD
jgi:hypothetical protein